MVDNGSSHRGEAAKRRLRGLDARVVLVPTPVHASWLNQVEIYFSIIQRKVLTPNDFADLTAVRVRLALKPRSVQSKWARRRILLCWTTTMPS